MYVIAILLFVLGYLKISVAQNFNSIINTNVISLNDFVFWPNATIPFFINSEHYDQEQSLAILQVLTLFAFKTCLKFTPVLVNPDSNQHVLVFQNPQGLKICSIPSTGHSPDEPEIITLAYGCLVSPLLEMIMMRRLGFPFEHNRWIRDLYVDVLLDNVETANVELFTKDVKLPVELRNLPYDINSVMHFGERDFSKNGHRTLIFKDSKVLQKRLSLTDMDVRKIDIVYGPECRRRDRQEKIEMCQQYPGVARRRKREIMDYGNSLQSSDDITEPVKEPKKESFEANTEDLEGEIRNLVHEAYEVASKILARRRLKYCKTSKLRSSNSFDVLNILDRMSDFIESIVKNAGNPNFCKLSDSVLNYNTAFHFEGPVIKTLKGNNITVSSSVSQVNQDRRKRGVVDAINSNSSPVDKEVPTTTVRVADDRRSLKDNTSIGSLNEDIASKNNNNNDDKKESSKPALDENPISKEVNEPNKFNNLPVTLDGENARSKAKYESPAETFNFRSKAIKTKVKLSPATKDFYSQRKWPNNVVRYYIMDDGLHNIDGLKIRLGDVNDILLKRTCVRIEPIKKSDMERFEDFLVLESNSSDYVTGRVGGKQIFGSLDLFEGHQHRQFTAMMVMAMLGFYFEVSRHDRDDYVKIYNSNIRPDKLHHFEKNPPEATIDLPYDYDGATHPSWSFWRKSGETDAATVATYKSLDPEGKIMKTIGQNEDLLSDIDVAKVNSVYGTRCFRKDFMRSKNSKNRKRRLAKLNSNKI